MRKTAVRTKASVKRLTTKSRSATKKMPVKSLHKIGNSDDNIKNDIPVQKNYFNEREKWFDRQSHKQLPIIF